MKRFLGSAIEGLLEAVPLSIYRRLLRREVIGVFYHAVTDGPLPHVRHLYPPIFPGRFEADLLYLKEHYQPVSYEELHACVEKRRPLPPRAVHLSFDDGYVECFTLARPLLLEHGIPCSFFVTTDFIDNRRMFYRNKISLCVDRMLELEPEAARKALARVSRALGLHLGDRTAFVDWIRELRRSDEALIDQICEILETDVEKYLLERSPYLTREQIRQMADEGFTIGAHTRSHPKLGRLPPEKVEMEIVASGEIVRQITGMQPVPFSFPNSATGVDRALLALLRARHPWLGLLFDTKGIRQDEPFMVNRVWAENPKVKGTESEVNLPRVLHAAYQEQARENLGLR